MLQVGATKVHIKFNYIFEQFFNNTNNNQYNLMQLQ